MFVSVVDFGHFQRAIFNFLLRGSAGLCQVGVILVDEFFPTTFDFFIAGIIKYSQNLIIILDGIVAGFEDKTVFDDDVVALRKLNDVGNVF